jgi:hypothetical protein
MKAHQRKITVAITPRIAPARINKRVVISHLLEPAIFRLARPKFFVPGDAEFLAVRIDIVVNYHLNVLAVRGGDNCPIFHFLLSAGALLLQLPSFV